MILSTINMYITTIYTHSIDTQFHQGIHLIQRSWCKKTCIPMPCHATKPACMLEAIQTHAFFTPGQQRQLEQKSVDLFGQRNARNSPENRNATVTKIRFVGLPDHCCSSYLQVLTKKKQHIIRKKKWHLKTKNKKKKQSRSSGFQDHWK